MLLSKLCTIIVYVGTDGPTSRKRLSNTLSQSEGNESTKRPKAGPGDDELDMDKIIKDHFLGMNVILAQLNYYFGHG